MFSTLNIKNIFKIGNKIIYFKGMKQLTELCDYFTNIEETILIIETFWEKITVETGTNNDSIESNIIDKNLLNLSQNIKIFGEILNKVHKENKNIL